MIRAPTTSVFAGTYSVMYPPAPRVALLGTGVNCSTKVSTSPTLALVSVPIPPGVGLPCGSSATTVAWLMRLAVCTWATLWARAAVESSRAEPAQRAMVARFMVPLSPLSEARWADRAAR